MPMPPSGAARPSFRVSNSAPASPPTLSPSMTLADRADRLDQAPERAEQAEKHQQAGHVAGNVARLVEPGGDRIRADAAWSAARCSCARCARRRESPPSAPAASGAGVDREPGIGDAEIVDPGDFGIEPDHLAERQDGADRQHQADQRVEAGIGQERVEDLLDGARPISAHSIRNTSIRTRKIRGEASLVCSRLLLAIGFSLTPELRFGAIWHSRGRRKARPARRQTCNEGGWTPE